MTFLYLFIFYLTKRSAAQTTWRRIEGRLVDNELERMWEGAAVTQLEMLSPNLPRLRKM
jgi:uncharacterized membrane protein YsdA (DUF1294 family)